MSDLPPAGEFEPRSTTESPAAVTPVVETPSAVEDEAAAVEPAGPVSSHPAPGVTVELTDVECRVLGALIEKAFLTPDVYPMTTNGLATACNQKTNRDPVVSFAPVLIDNALLELRQRNLVRRVHTPGSRSTKHRQTLDEVLNLDQGELALMSVLMLRGPQTVGELRLRSERQHGFEDLDATEACLRNLESRTIALVRQLPRQPGHKEARWQHLLGDPAATAAASEAVASDAASTAPTASAVATAPPAQVPAVTDSGLAARVDALEAEVATLRRQLSSLALQLGETLE